MKGIFGAMMVFLTFLFILGNLGLGLINSEAQAQMQEARMNVLTLSGGSLASGVPSPTTFPCTDTTHDGKNNAVVFCEDFEGALHCEDDAGAASVCRLDHEWVALDACDTAVTYNYTTNPLDGTNSLYLNETSLQDTCSKKTSFAAADNMYLFARIKFAVMNLTGGGGQSGSILTFRSSDNVTLCSAAAYYTGAATVWATYTNSTWTASAVTPAINTEYYVWLEFQKNTASGCNVYISETSTKPGSPTVTSSNTTDNKQATYLRVLTRATAANNTLNQIKVDDILLNTSALGSP